MAAVQLMVPPAPTGGVVQLKSVVLAVRERNVVPGGSASVTVTLWMKYLLYLFPSDSSAKLYPQ